MSRLGRLVHRVGVWRIGFVLLQASIATLIGWLAQPYAPSLLLAVYVGLLFAQGNLLAITAAALSSAWPLKLALAMCGFAYVTLHLIFSLSPSGDLLEIASMAAGPTLITFPLAWWLRGRWREILWHPRRENSQQFRLWQLFVLVTVSAVMVKLGHWLMTRSSPSPSSSISLGIVFAAVGWCPLLFYSLAGPRPFRLILCLSVAAGVGCFFPAWHRDADPEVLFFFGSMTAYEAIIMLLSMMVIRKIVSRAGGESENFVNSRLQSNPRHGKTWSLHALQSRKAPMNFLQEITASFACPAAENPTVEMIEAAYRHHKMPWRYINFEVRPEHLADAVAGARAMGFAGFNCSIPHKVAVIEHLDALGESATIIGAVNCVVRRDNRLIGENTDGKGFVASLRTKREPDGLNVTILGAGGAARAIAVETALAGAASVTIVNRNVDRGKELARLVNDQTPARGAFIPWRDTYEVPEECDVLVNATSVGLYPNVLESVNLMTSTLGPGTLVADVIPNPLETNLLRAASEQGCDVLNGLGMLVNQGVISIKYWTGQDVDEHCMRQRVIEVLDMDRVDHAAN